MLKDKIILIIRLANENQRSICGFIGNYENFGLNMKRMGYSDEYVDPLLNKIRINFENGKEGKMEFDDAIVFVLPESIVRLHTQQHPLIIFKDDEVIDIDEWWYSPFRGVIGACNLGEYTNDNKDWSKTDCPLESLECGFLVKFRSNPDDEWTYAIKSNNVGFNR